MKIIEQPIDIDKAPPVSKEAPPPSEELEDYEKNLKKTRQDIAKDADIAIEGLIDELLGA